MRKFCACGVDDHRRLGVSQVKHVLASMGPRGCPWVEHLDDPCWYNQMDIAIGQCAAKHRHPAMASAGSADLPC
jgi:hypothetical protein